MADIHIEGYSADELLDLPGKEVERYVFTNEAIAFRIGSAEVLGRFELGSDRIVVELAEIDGGGEGVLATLSSLVSRFAKLRDLRYVEWRVHAVSCADPNLKLRRVLEKRGFEIVSLEGVGRVYHQVNDFAASA